MALNSLKMTRLYRLQSPDTRAAADLCPVDGVVVLGASLRVGVVHQRQVSQSRAPLSGSLLSGAPPQQAHSHISCVVVLKGDLLNLKHTASPVRHNSTTLLLLLILECDFIPNYK